MRFQTRGLGTEAPNPVYIHCLTDTAGQTVYSAYVRDVNRTGSSSQVCYKSYASAKPAPVALPIRNVYTCDNSITDIYGYPVCYTPQYRAAPVTESAPVTILAPAPAPAPVAPSVATPAVPQVSTPATLFQASTSTPVFQEATPTPILAAPAPTPEWLETPEQAPVKTDDNKTKLIVGGIVAALVVGGIVAYSMNKKK